MPHYEVKLRIDNIGSRNDIRMEVVNILDDLTVKYQENPIKYATLYEALEKTYYCEHIDYSTLDSLYFETGFPCDLLVKTLKWLFIKQDIRYWNYSGRDMLWKGIYSINH